MVVVQISNTLKEEYLTCSSWENWGMVKKKRFGVIPTATGTEVGFLPIAIVFFMIRIWKKVTNVI